MNEMEIKQPGPNDCTTEPNGEKIWYPHVYPFYPEGSHMDFESWTCMCKAGKWVTDGERLKQKNEADRPRRELISAAHTRILSTEELTGLMNYGSRIFVESGRPFYQNDVDAKFMALLKFQELLRMDDLRKEGKLP